MNAPDPQGWLAICDECWQRRHSLCTGRTDLCCCLCLDGRLLPLRPEEAP